MSDPAAKTVKTREALLDRLKSEGPQDVRALSAFLEVSEIAVRQHLAGLEAGGQVESRRSPRPVGRPAMLWRLTDAAQARYPDAHSDLALDLIADMRALFGEDAMDRLLERRSHRQIGVYGARMKTGRSLKARLEALAEMRSREGYMAEVTRDADGAWLLVENHCPVCHAARACSGLCRQELEIFRTVLGDDVTVERTDHILAGARRCAYRVTKAQDKA